MRLNLLCLMLLSIAQWAQGQPKKSSLNYDIFCFYYNWYGNPEHDQGYVHWAHPVIKSQPSDTVSGHFPGGDNIAANFYPALGAYSSNDKKVIAEHMKMIKKAGIGTISLSWWNDSFTTKSILPIMDEAAKNKIKVSFHIEPFRGRNAETMYQAVRKLIDDYGSHPAFYRTDSNKPLFFVYDSYLTDASEWAVLLGASGTKSIRNTKYDAIFIGLWVKEDDASFFKTSGFDGFYTYFASSGFTFGSTPSNWSFLQEWALANNKIFIPCVGPGYIDTRVRPWNSINIRDRELGKYYDLMFSWAIESKPRFIGITSFNEWHEGTQIEPATVFQSSAFKYLDYSPLEPDYYLKRTHYWQKRFKKLKR